MTINGGKNKNQRQNDGKNIFSGWKVEQFEAIMSHRQL